MTQQSQQHQGHLVTGRITARGGGGTDIRALDLPGYRQQLGVVPQEPYLFPGTVRDAIAYRRPDATDADVEAAARGVGAIEMIARLPGGFRPCGPRSPGTPSS